MARPLSDAVPTSSPESAAADEAPPVSAASTARSVRGQLALFTTALLVPILLFLGYVTWEYATGERKRLQGEATGIAQLVASSVDREITGLFASLEVLSTSAYLKTRDLDGFHGQAVDLQNRLGVVTVLTDMTGRQLVNTRLPLGQALPVSSVPFDEAALATGRPYVTDLVVGQVTGNRQFLAVTSVRRDDRPAYVLFFSLPLARLQRILGEIEIAAGYTVSIVDRQGLIMARNLRPEEFVGREATADLRRSTSGQAGTWDGTTADGTPVFGAYARSGLSGFRAAVGIRYSDLNAPLWRSLSAFLGLGLAIGALSVLLGYLFGKRITAPISSLARQAAKLGQGEPVPPLSTGLLEANQVAGEIAAASANLRERESDLRDANEELQRFAYIVSHDLRSPLVNIMGFTTELEALREEVFKRIEALRKEASDRHDTRDSELATDFDEAIGFIKSSIAKMDRLINAILALSRQGRREFSPERVDMEALLATIRDTMAHQADAVGATVTIGRLPALVSDRLALEQIFSNLIDNALKYLRADVPGLIQVRGRASGPLFVYEVADNGRGIDPRDAQRVFDLFRRSGVQDRPGEGIGLAHVRTLVRRLGGSIALTSSPGQGSTFTVTLPRRWTGERQRKAA